MVALALLIDNELELLDWLITTVLASLELLSTALVALELLSTALLELLLVGAEGVLSLPPPPLPPQALKLIINNPAKK